VSHHPKFVEYALQSANSARMNAPTIRMNTARNVPAAVKPVPMNAGKWLGSQRKEVWADYNFTVSAFPFIHRHYWPQERFWKSARTKECIGIQQHCSSGLYFFLLNKKHILALGIPGIALRQVDKRRSAVEYFAEGDDEPIV
jgi:hypothetical protein